MIWPQKTNGGHLIGARHQLASLLALMSLLLRSALAGTHMPGVALLLSLLASFALFPFFVQVESRCSRHTCSGGLLEFFYTLACA